MLINQIGGYEIYAIETGRFMLDGGAMFGIVPKPLWERRIPADAQNRIPLSMRCLLLIGNGQVILVDNGLGNKYDEKFRKIYAVDEEYAELHRSLKNCGVHADDVTDLIITHLHFDHCGGTTLRQGEKLEMTFKNAQHYVQKNHWEWANDPNVNPRERNSFLKENLDPLQHSGQLVLLDGNTPFNEHIRLQTVNGHTEAQQIVFVEDGQKSLCFVADLLPTAAHLPPAWVMGYDLFPLTSITEKGAFLKEAAQKQTQIVFEHDPIVAAAYVQQTESGMQLQAPIHQQI